MMRVLGNFLWHIPGLGFLSAILAYVFGLIMVVTVIGTPIGVGLFELGSFLFAPFTRKLVLRKDIDGDIESKAWKSWSNIAIPLYIPLGLGLFVLNILSMLLVIVTATATIVGIVLLIPYLYTFANALTTILNPAGKKCVNYIVSEELERQKATELIKKSKKARKKAKK